ncbi:MAG: SBBP repeat-containing protein [Flavobacteriales bacterium]|nr:SBBP repeat-containing protein [Flavobacteriales bacterium]
MLSTTSRTLMATGAPQFKFFAAALIVVLSAGPGARAQVPAWAMALGSPGYEEARGIAVAKDGRVFITGEFENTADFAGQTLTSAGFSDAFLACYTNTGTLEYALAFPGAAKSQGYGVAIAPDGTVYTTGIFTGTVDLDPGPGTALHTSGGLYDVYLCALTPGGELLWAGVLGGPGNEETRSVVTDGDGHVYLAGEMHGSFDADPGPATAMVVSNGSFDAFVAKYSPAGVLQWAHAIGGAGDDRAYDLTARPDGGVVITGYYAGTVDLDPGPGVATISTPTQWSNAFLVELAADGTYLWGANLGGTGTDTGRGVALDSLGNVVVAGRFTRTAYFGALGQDSLVCTGPDGDADIFLAKYGADGGFIWAKGIGGTEENMPRGVATDRNGNILVAGRTKGIIDFDPGPGSALDTASGVFDLFLAKYSTQGDHLWGFTAGSSYHARGLNVTTDAAGSVYLTGWITEDVDIDPGPDTLWLVNHGDVDAYLAKFSDNGLYTLTLDIQLDDQPAATSWELWKMPGNEPLFAGAGPETDAGQAIGRSWQVPAGCYRLALMDADGDGITDGGYTASTQDSALIIADGAFGSLSALAGDGQFCLPLGTTTLTQASCAQGVFVPGETIQAEPQPGADQYTFWFFDPHGSFSGTVETDEPELPVYYLPPGTPAGVPLNVRVGTWTGGTSLPYGPACAIAFDGLTALAEAPPARGIRVYPNPAQGGQAHVQAWGLPAGEWTLVVRDALGREAATAMVHAAGGPAACQLATGGLAQGLYSLELQGPGPNLVQRLLIVR